jgi:hypothetical protein
MCVTDMCHKLPWREVKYKPAGNKLNVHICDCLQFLFLNFLYNLKVTTPARFTAYRLVVPCQKCASTSVGGCLFWNSNGSSFQLGNCSGISSNASCLFDVKFVFRVELSFILPLCLHFILLFLSEWHPPLPSQCTNKLRGFSPRANHTDRAAAAGRRS